MLISVIMPCYCCSGTIERAVQSLQSQSVSDWELIAVDDGSPENDYEILCALAKKDSRIKVFHQENAGVSSARNLGIQKAAGQWLFFLDADDYLTKDAFRTLLDAASGQEDIVCGAYEIVVGALGTRTFSACKNGDLRIVTDSLIRGDSALNSMCARLYRAEFIKENKLKTKPNIAIGEDVLFNLEAFRMARSWKILNDVVYIYDYGGDSAMVKAKRNVYQKSLPMMMEISAFLHQNGLAEKHFRSHIDVWLFMLRQDRGRIGAALEYGHIAAKEVTKGVDPHKLATQKEKLYYWALKLFPFSSVLLP